MSRHNVANWSRLSFKCQIAITRSGNQAKPSRRAQETSRRFSVSLPMMTSGITATAWGELSWAAFAQVQNAAR